MGDWIVRYPNALAGMKNEANPSTTFPKEETNRQTTPEPNKTNPQPEPSRDLTGSELDDTEQKDTMATES